MDFYCRVTSTGLVPLDEIDAEAKAQLRIGSDVRVTVTHPRNIRFHRKFFALLHITVTNLPEHITFSMHIYNVETMLAAVKIDLGYYDAVQVGSREVIKLRSISFTKMSADEFEKFYDLAVTDILNNYLKGTDKDDLLEEVEQFISRKY